ncbi:glycosyltransferase family 2 protein [Acetobacter fabarum]|uniref:glycosyltransferase family 2 protein n=1 Tax=Acetobacter fabarum TaxID=483199 RepID=UPI00312B9461
MTEVLASFGQRVRKRLGIRLGRLSQFAPQPLARYQQVRVGHTVLPDLPDSGLPTPSVSGHDWPSFIIVTPSYNQAQFIGRTIASVLNQNYPRLEYIVQDGQSNDGTQAVLDGLSGQGVTVRIEADAGQADAINRGFMGTEGEIMAYLNSDDLLLPGTLEMVAHYFDNHPEVDAIYGDRLIIDETDSVIGHWRLPYHDGWAMRTVYYVPQETLFWRRRAWKKVDESFNSDLHFAMDWDFLLRLQQKGMQIRHVPRFLGAFRVHAAQKTIANIAHGRQEMQYLRHRHSSLSCLFIAQFRHVWLLVRHVWQEMSDPL